MKLNYIQGTCLSLECGELSCSSLCLIIAGLPSHPQHEVATETFKGYGGMVSFRIKGGLEQSQKFMQAVKVGSVGREIASSEISMKAISALA